MGDPKFPPMPSQIAGYAIEDSRPTADGMQEVWITTAAPPAPIRGVALANIPAGAAVDIEIDPRTGRTTMKPASGES